MNSNLEFGNNVYVKNGFRKIEPIFSYDKT